MNATLIMRVERCVFLLFFSCLQGTVASTASCLQLHKRAERVAAALMGRLNTGDHVALVYPPGRRAGSPRRLCSSAATRSPCLVP